MTQAELAQLSGTTQQQIALIEKGASDPRLSTLKKIANALEIHIGDLFYTDHGFIKEINHILDSNSEARSLNLSDLNSYCSRFLISPFEQCWEKVTIDKKLKKIKLK